MGSMCPTLPPRMSSRYWAELAFRSRRADSAGPFNGSALLETDLYSAMRIVRSADGSECRFFVEELPQMPGLWPVTVGGRCTTCAHALDHAAYELALLGLRRELTADEARWSRFPLVTKPSDYNEKNLDRWLPGVDDETRALIERVQPYPERDRNYSPTAYEQAAYYLGLLNDLGIVEKHRHTHFIVLSCGPGSWMAEHPEPWFFEGALEPGRLVATVPYYPEFKPYVSMQPRPSFSTLLIHPQGPSAMPGVLSVLALMAERVLDVLDPSQWFDGRRSKHLEPLPRTEATR